jgi:hypothetical protein
VGSCLTCVPIPKHIRRSQSSTLCTRNISCTIYT